MLPLISQAVPEQWWLSSYLFPPLDDAFRLPALLVTGLITVIVYRLADSPLAKSRKRRVYLQLVAFGLVIVGVSAFLIARTAFVRTIERPSVGDAVSVTVGFERTPFALQTFSDANDWEILRQRGTTEEEIFRLWTTRSVLIARWALLLSYLLFLGSAVGVLSLEVLFSVVGQPTEP